jgi:hypothetical protein
LKAIEQALAVSQKAEPNIRLSVAVNPARIRAASLHNGSLTPVLGGLISTLAEARKRGYSGIELEARLALGEIEVKSGVRTRGRAQLQTVERDASQKGFVLSARKAASHLREAAEQAIMDQSGGFPFQLVATSASIGAICQPGGINSGLSVIQYHALLAASLQVVSSDGQGSLQRRSRSFLPHRTTSA